MSVVQFPPVEFPTFEKPAELLLGPFEVWRVIVDGRVIPNLTGYREGPDQTCFVVDDRFGCSVPNEIAHSVAYVIANAMAVGAGYSHLGAVTKDMPFAPAAVGLDTVP